MIISLLAKPFSFTERLAKDLERRFNYIKYTIMGNAYKAWTCTFPAGGHQDIVDSFIKGAKFYQEVEVRINPSRQEAEGSVIYIPSGWKALRDAIWLKKSGKIDKIITGPVGANIDDYDGIILSGAIDACVVPCEWYKKKCEKEAAEKNLRFDNIQVWPVGVDHNVWNPSRGINSENMRRALVYVKGKGVRMLEATQEVLRGEHKECRIIMCGGHTPREYKELLEWCDFVVYLGHSETQGLALAQAWAMDRQTLVYEPELFFYDGLDAAPYLTEFTGRKWHDPDSLRERLQSLAVLSPREWILKNQTNEIAFGNFLKIIEKLR
ncbi:MAG: hypothetical protein Q4C86_03320 [bacterium]|nr:hypothetical protein [bacterium]